MTYYIKNGTLYRPTDEANVDIRTLLPAGNYVIREDQFGNMFFETVDGFTVNFKRYGDNPRHTRRILNTFQSRENSTGVMLTGEKGSGKSLLAKTISMEAVKDGVPTIIINAPWCGDNFNTLIQSVDQPAIVLFDEFEKVYNEAQQEQILTLLDGVFPTKKLFVFTCNDKWRVDRHMRNRPGRIFYMLDFKGLDVGFIEEYCNDNLNAKEHIPLICRLSTLFSQFNFDMLKSLVEEMNRYNEGPIAALEMLNVRPEFDEGRPTFTMILTRDGQVLKTRNTEFMGNPLTLNYWMYYHDPELKRNEDDDEDDIFNGELLFSRDHLTAMQNDVFVFTQEGITLTLTRKEETKRVNWMDALTV